MYPREQQRTFISSITSTNLRKLVLTLSSTTIRREVLYDSSWEPFDGMICGLVDRLQALGYKHTLEVEFRANCVELGGEMRQENFLPKFREKGRVRVVEDLTGRFWEWP